MTRACKMEIYIMHCMDVCLHLCVWCVCSMIMWVVGKQIRGKLTEKMSPGVPVLGAGLQGSWVLA